MLHSQNGCAHHPAFTMHNIRNGFFYYSFIQWMHRKPETFFRWNSFFYALKHILSANKKKTSE